MLGSIPDHRITLRLSEVADVLGYSPSTVRRMVSDKKLPPAIDDSVSPKLRRWSRPEIERYARADHDSDPTPPHGIVRPLMLVTGTSG